MCSELHWLHGDREKWRVQPPIDSVQKASRDDKHQTIPQQRGKGVDPTLVGARLEEDREDDDEDGNYGRRGCETILEGTRRVVVFIYVRTIVGVVMTEGALGVGVHRAAGRHRRNIV